MAPKGFEFSLDNEKFAPFEITAARVSPPLRSDDRLLTNLGCSNICSFSTISAPSLRMSEKMHPCPKGELPKKRLPISEGSLFKSLGKVKRACYNISWHVPNRDM
jgi:hypothetical protein